ncbi:hypothetical protein QR680_013907 [Steinernema hermaphroditum]|uniref:ShKT domain-containing protein n=1 Tax=Steinernema hermaphroditum TaxID=289476 RepID=A0AA39I9U7_9BILA|nr:hypothetical protein QR680_013907 [Steinernema hermaphroditum]
MKSAAVLLFLIVICSVKADFFDSPFYDEAPIHEETSGLNLIRACTECCDKGDNCHIVKQNGYCAAYTRTPGMQRWITNNCMKTCGFCGTGKK